MSWSQHPKIPAEMYQVGQEVDAVVLGVDREERKMSLGIKQLMPDPWSNVPLKYAVGSRHTGTVRNITNYGCFLEMEEGVDGFIHVQDLSWMKKVNHPSDVVVRDQKLDVIVLELDVENRKLRMGHKQVTEDPWEKFESVFPIYSRHTGVITKMTDKGAVVELEYGVEGFCPGKHLRTVDEHVPVEGESLDFIVIEFSKETKKIMLSHLKSWKEDDVAPEVAEVKKKAASKKKDSGPLASVGNDEGSTLGDLSELASLKAKMEADN
jgi:small subunit ribosomal protein S1